jgi:hypothetical protein
MSSTLDQSWNEIRKEATYAQAEKALVKHFNLWFERELDRRYYQTTALVSDESLGELHEKMVLVQRPVARSLLDRISEDAYGRIASSPSHIDL